MKSRFALIALALALGLASARAQVVWDGLGGNWSDGLSWLGLVPPASGDTVEFLTFGGTSNVDYSVTLNGLDFATLVGPLTLTSSGGAVLTIATGHTISYASAFAVDITAPLAGGGNLWLNAGTGTLTLTAATPGQNTYSGSTQVYAGGTLADGAANSFSDQSILYVGGPTPGTVDVNYDEAVAGLGDVGGGPGTVHIAGGATLRIDGGYSTTFSGVITGPSNAGLDYENAGTLMLLGANTLTGTTTIGTNVAVELGNGGTTGSLASGTVTGGGVLDFNHSDAISFAGNLVGGLNVVQQGSGTTTLTGTNTYSGPTTINAGTLQAGSASAFGGSTGQSAVLLNGSGVLQLNGFNTDIGSLASASPTTAVYLNGATLSIDSGSANTSFAGALHGSGGLTFNGYTLSLTGSGNDYTGVTTINSGTLLADNATGSATGNSSGIHISSGANLQLGNLDTRGAIAAGTNIYDYGTLVFAQSSGSLLFANTVVGTGGVAKYGTYSTLILYAGGSSYTGDTVINAGLVQDAAANSFSPSSQVAVGNGTTLENFYDEAVGSLKDLTGAAGAVIINSGTTLTSNGLNYTGDFTGPISGPGRFSVSGGVQGLAGNNTYTGGTLVTAGGEVFIGSNTAFGTGTVTFADATEFSPSADITIANNLVLNGTTDIENDDGLNYNLTLSGQISGSNGYEWCTPGTLTVTNANTMLGGIDMREGNLVLTNNAAAGTGAITLASSTSLTVPTGIAISNPLNPTGTSAIVQGSGTLSAALVVNSAIILNPTATPGGGPGTLTFSGGLTLDSGGALNFKLYDATGAAGTGSSLLAATGGLDLTATPGTFLINVSSINATGGAANAIHFSPGTPYTWTLATSTSPISGFSANQFIFNTSGFLNGGGIFNVTEVGNSLELNFTPVPEPSTWILLGAGALAIAGLSIRRRRLARA